MKKLVGLAAVCFALTACGGSTGTKTGSTPSTSSTNGEENKTPQQVFSDAKAAFGASTALHLAGTLQGGVQNSGDLQQQAGQITESASFGTVHVINTGGKIYLQAPAAYWAKTQAANLAGRLANKWITLPGSSPIGLQTTVQGFASTLSASNSPLRPTVTRTQANGRPAVVVTTDDGSQLFVSDVGSPVPLRLVNKGPGMADLTFSDYGKVTPIAPPPNPLTPQAAAG